MLVLDTDHLSELEVGSASGRRLLARLQSCGDDATITAITVEEQLRGWLAEIRRRAPHHFQIAAYARLIRTVESTAKWTILPWDQESAATLESLLKVRVRIGTQDLKIAAITLAHEATLLTRNKRDFMQIPGLRFENWLEE